MMRGRLLSDDKINAKAAATGRSAAELAHSVAKVAQLTAAVDAAHAERDALRTKVDEAAHGLEAQRRRGAEPSAAEQVCGAQRQQEA